VWVRVEESEGRKAVSLGESETAQYETKLGIGAKARLCLCDPQVQE
jgi:hypothetical protein